MFAGSGSPFDTQAPPMKHQPGLSASVHRSCASLQVSLPQTRLVQGVPAPTQAPALLQRSVAVQKRPSLQGALTRTLQSVWLRAGSQPRHWLLGWGVPEG